MCRFCGAAWTLPLLVESLYLFYFDSSEVEKLFKWRVVLLLGIDDVFVVVK